jgi:hypothetical protein
VKRVFADRTLTIVLCIALLSFLVLSPVGLNISVEFVPATISLAAPSASIAIRPRGPQVHGQPLSFLFLDSSSPTFAFLNDN